MANPRPTKAARREDARAAALRLRAEQEAAARRQRIVAIVLLVVGLVVVGGVVAFILLQSSATDETDGGDPPALSEVVAPQGATDSGGIPVGADGVAGQGGDAPVTLTVYADYMCPFCGLFETTNGPVLDEMRESGEVVVEYHPVSILDRFAEGSEYSTRAATAVAHVADQAPESFLALNALLFENQPAEQTAGLSDAEIADLAREAGVAEEVAATIEDGSYLEGDASLRPWVEAATAQASEDLGGLSTPTILVNGEVLDTAEYDWRQEGELERAVADAQG